RDRGAGPFPGAKASAPQADHHGDQIDHEGDAVDHAHRRHQMRIVEAIFEWHGHPKQGQSGDAFDKADAAKDLDHALWLSLPGRAVKAARGRYAETPLHFAAKSLF